MAINIGEKVPDITADAYVNGSFQKTFIIDPDCILRYCVISDLSVGRSVTETLRVLQALQSGELCPVEWTPGKKTLGRG